MGLFDSDLLMWKSRSKTGSLLASFNIIVILAALTDVRLTAVFCNLLMVGIIIGGAVKHALPNPGDLKLWSPSKDQISSIISSGLGALEVMATTVHDVVLWSDPARTIKAIVVCDVVRRLHEWVSLTWIFFLLGNLLFAMPLVAQHKDKITPHFEKFNAKKAELLALVPRYDPKWDE
eukprot:CAMPEP_0194495850 /NCGR_PEP_ID=MMETSP0253-20130528/13314_1 /TAXON_ID=2966 /ORGANISM="Noctiluca scintillans" /LENGTH=176 /DNA_ID=CAMNT_0039337171 /DNA_START=63 /DNA_END=593 /DNA_ORIENTATION=+